MNSLFYFDTLSDFLTMGGHGLYVWLAYGSYAAILLWNYCSIALKPKIEPSGKE